MTATLHLAAQHRAADDRHDAIEMLIADHTTIKKLFALFDTLREDPRAADQKAALVQQICRALDVHCHIEEDIFYPVVRKAIDDPALMDKALVEHAGAKALVAQLKVMQVGDRLFDAKVMVLAEQVEHHAAEEEDDMFPEATRAKVDTLALGAVMAKRRAQLTVGQANGGADGVSRSKPRQSDRHTTASR